jgi:transposase-like protein
MTTPVLPSYAGHRFPAEIISHAVWLYFRFPLSLRMVDELLALGGSPSAMRKYGSGR